MTIGETGLLHALLSPTTVSTSINGGAVTVECETNYPFEDVLLYKINAQKGFDFYVRQPGWAEGASLSSSAGKSTYDSTTGLHKISLPSGASTVTYTINTSVRTEPRANDTVAIYRGQVLYAAHIGAEISSTRPHNYTSQELYPVGYAPPQSRDYTMMNTTEWNIAIDPSTIEYHPAFGGASSDTTRISITPLATPIFAPGAPPMNMTVKACLIDWPLFKGSVPGWPLPKKNRTCLGDTFEAKLVPYGSAKLRMDELPTISLQ